MSAVAPRYATSVLNSLPRDNPGLAPWQGTIDDASVQQALEQSATHGATPQVATMTLAVMAKCLAHAYHTGRLSAWPTTADFLSAINSCTPSHFGLTEAEVGRIRAHLQARVANQQTEAAAHALVGMGQQHSLLKPEIGHRVALMHGTTKRRWERQARAF